MKQVKKIALWTLLAFIVYAIVQSPSQAADIVGTIWDIIMKAFRSVGSFFNDLLNQ